MFGDFDADTRSMRRGILTMSFQAGEGHIPSALSIVDILYVLYRDFLPNHGALRTRESGASFVLSKGHGSLALYQALAMAGQVSDDDLRNFARYDSILGGHPDRTKVPGVVASTGSLGHGLAIAVGIALARRALGNLGRVFVLIGDGEANEGSVWEAALLAGHHSLRNLTCIIDNNHSTDRALNLDSVAAKFEAFGWATSEIDGHNEQEIIKALSLHPSSTPLAIVANTIKGKGISSMEANPEWHHKTPTADEFAILMQDLS